MESSNSAVETINGTMVTSSRERDSQTNFGRPDSPVLSILRRVLQESRTVARKEGSTERVRPMRSNS